MSEHSDSRRRFLAAGGAFWAAAQFPALAAAANRALASQADFVALTADQARGVEAMAMRIFPSDETPGAREVGVIHFIDQALAGPMAGMKAPILGGLQALDEAAGGVFAAQPEERQDDLLRAQERSPFFGLLRLLTLGGMFAMPRYGGNRELLGWELIGFDHRHAWTPPFGHYDREPPA